VRSAARDPYRRLIYTGPIDEYFDFRLGRLPYRSLRFEHVTRDTEWHQPVGVVNYPQDRPYTRVTEYKHLTGQQHRRTSLTYEYPSAEGDPYYPVPRPENAALYKQYEALAAQVPTCGSSAVWRPIATTTWTRWWGRRFAALPPAGNRMNGRAMANDRTGKVSARLPRGFGDRGPADIAATETMLAGIREVYELYGFEAVETPPSSTPTRSASSCPTRTGRTRASSPSRTTTSSGCRCATT
jgi:hypothetical protein